MREETDEKMTETQRQRLGDLADRVRDHCDRIDQDVPDQSYAVGGCVRDTLLGVEPTDLDVVVVGEPLDSGAVVRAFLLGGLLGLGIRFGIGHIRISPFHGNKGSAPGIDHVTEPLGGPCRHGFPPCWFAGSWFPSRIA